MIRPRSGIPKTHRRRFLRDVSAGVMGYGLAEMLALEHANAGFSKLAARAKPAEESRWPSH